MSFHMSGGVSGWDTQGMIDTLIEAERVPIYRAENEVYEMQDKLTAWSTVDSLMSTLHSKAQALINYSTWNQVAASSTDENVATAYAADGTSQGEYDLVVTQLATRHRIAGDAQTDTGTALGLAGDFTIGGETVTVAAEHTLADIRDAVNTAARSMDDAERVNATIIGTTLVLEREATGDTDIDVADGAAGVLQSLGVVEADGTTPKNEKQTSEDLAGAINGIAVTASENTGLTDLVDGVTFNVFDEGTCTVAVSRDTASIKALLEDFITAYNDAMAELEEQGKVDLSSDGGEVTDTGVLQGDSMVFQLQSRARTIVTGSETNPAILPAEFNSLRDIGIWTRDRTNRLAIVDEETLDNALANNLDEVRDLVRAYDGGIVRKLFDYTDIVTDPIDGTLWTRQQTLGSSITRRQDEITDMENALIAYETELWEQFARMEEALSDIQGQGSYIISQFTNTSKK